MAEKGKRAETHIAERRLYELFGIRLFRKLALKLESFRHRNDNSRNINYHLHGSGISSVESFTGYLLYNAVWHSISLTLVSVYFTITWIVGARYIVFNVFMCTLFIIDLYCIILQRYTYIKTQELTKRLVTTKNSRMADKIERLLQRIEHRDYKELQKELLLIERIQENIHNGFDCVIEECDASVLRNISKSAQDVLETGFRGKKDNNEGESLENAVLRISKYPLVISKVTRRAAKLQNIFRLKKSSNVLFDFSIISATGDCENAYRALIRDTSRDSLEFVFDVLWGAYNKALSSLRRTQI